MSLDPPDTRASSIVTDHHFVPKEGEPWKLCQYPNCNLSEAAHALPAIEDTDPGRPPSMRDETSNETYVRELLSREETLRAQGHKDDDNKAPFFFLPWEALEEVSYVMEYGAKKYAPGNYRKGMRSSRLFSASIRHVVDWWRGRDKDPETGRSHLAHAVCCILMLMETEINNRATDDRYAGSIDPAHSEPR